MHLRSTPTPIRSFPEGGTPSSKGRTPSNNQYSRAVLWVAVAWGVAGVIGLGLLGYFGYQVAWRSARLRRDLEQLAGLRQEASRVQEQVALARERAVRLRATH